MAPYDGDRACDLECPRHPGKRCHVSGIGNLGAIFGRKKGEFILPAKTTRHRHSHIDSAAWARKNSEEIVDGMATHYWGSDPRTRRSGHAYSFAYRQMTEWMTLDEAQYDRALRNRRIRDRAIRAFDLLERLPDEAVLAERLGMPEAYTNDLRALRGEIDPPEVVLTSPDHEAEPGEPLAPEEDA